MVVKFYEVSLRPQDMSLFYYSKIWQLLDGQIIWQNFLNPQYSNQFQKCYQCLYFPDFVRPKQLKFWSKILEDHSSWCWLVILIYPGLLVVSKPMNKPQVTWCTAQEYCTQHLNLPFVDPVCHVGPRANAWKFFNLIIRVLGPIVLNFSSFGHHLSPQKNHLIKPIQLIKVKLKCDLFTKCTRKPLNPN